MGLGDDIMEQLERFLLLVSHEDVLQAPDVAVDGGLNLAWSSERLTKLGSAIYTIIQGYTDKAISVTSQLLSWVTHFTLQVRGLGAWHGTAGSSTCARRSACLLHSKLACIVLSVFSWRLPRVGPAARLKAAEHGSRRSIRNPRSRLAPTGRVAGRPQVSISLILTFMFLWDWPNISRGVRSMRQSRIGGVYSEVAPSLLVFAQLFGKALQAQTRIAVVNTLLTFAGMWLLGIPGLLLLSLFVFLCRRARLRRRPRAALDRARALPLAPSIPPAHVAATAAGAAASRGRFARGPRAASFPSWAASSRPSRSASSR